MSREFADICVYENQVEMKELLQCYLYTDIVYLLLRCQEEKPWCQQLKKSLFIDFFKHGQPVSQIQPEACGWLTKVNKWGENGQGTFNQILALLYVYFWPSRFEDP